MPYGNDRVHVVAADNAPELEEGMYPKIDHTTPLHIKNSLLPMILDKVDVF